VFPYTGIILMFAGAAFLTGLLVHVFLIALFVEAIARRVPRFLMIIPVATYGAYYAALGQQAFDIASKSAELRASNPDQVMQFDPDTQSLVTKDAKALVTGYAIPVAYEPNPDFKPEGHLSYRLIRRDQCNITRDSQARVWTFGMHFENRLQPQVCLLVFPEAPKHAIVTIATRGEDEIWKRNWGISEQSTELIVDGKIIATYRTASVWRLPVLPKMEIGCLLISSVPAWKCGAHFVRTYVNISTVPEHVDFARYDSPISVMLGIKKYDAQDLANFPGFPQNEPALASVNKEAGRVEDEVFGVLNDIVGSRNPKPTFNMPYSVAINGARLAPLAEGMAKRLVELNDPSAMREPYRDDQIRVLAAGLAALPRDAFARIADAAFAAIQTDKSPERMPVLYVRAADAGRGTLAFYKREFLTAQFKYTTILPVLAICRIGQADDETIAEMKARFVSAKDAGSLEFQSALAVTLLKLGQESFLRDHMDAMRAKKRGWMDAVLEKRGWTETGPNNCMTDAWHTTDYLGPIMAPSLRYEQGAWSARQ
jgi:hypothetical protein